MIDLVTANEFTFTPSAFIAAYIEQATTTSVTEQTVNSGTLSTVPNRDIDNITTTISSTSSPTPSGTSTFSHTGFPASSATSGSVFEYSTASSNSAIFIPGETSTTTGYTISGNLLDILGQNVTDGRSVTKTTTTSTGVVGVATAAQTVVLVLSYGQFRANCANAQSTVTLIYTRVSEYLNSLV